MSMPPPSAGTTAPDAPLPYGRPVRRRIGVPAALILSLAAALALVSLHDQVVYYRVDSGSMQPTLPVGSRVAVEPGVAPRIGEIVAFHAPAGAVPATAICANPGQGAGFSQPCGLATPAASGVVFVKRIVAGPGDLVLLRSGQAVVNGVTQSQPSAAPCGGPECNFATPIRVPPGQYYVLGDNRAVSDDSRFWGPIPASSIVGVLVDCAPLQTACQPGR